MCGIVGGLSFRGVYFPDKSELSLASGFLEFRGPDDSGDLFLEIGCTKLSMAHRRLSIIDLSSSGHQPMTSNSGRSYIVFNGEIYNYQELRSELIARGYSFKSNSDTEVILNGYECWGFEEMLCRLDGMFALALFDKPQETLFLARDRFGKKPLYYHVHKKGLVFSSDIRSFKKISGIDLTLDLYALGYFFAELATPHEATIWKEVKKLLPGNFLTFTKDGVANRHYWQLSYTEDCTLKQPEIVEKTEYLLRKAVKKRLVADVNVSALLSGGIDSSLIVAMMAEHSTQKVNTYSVGFKEENYNELVYAREVAERFDTQHTEIVIDAESFQNVDKLILEYGEPFADSSMIPTYLMSKEISKTEKVVLGGDGGDELFGGYSSYYFASKYDMVKSLAKFYPMVNTLSRILPFYRLNFLKRLLLQTNYPDYTMLNRNIGFGEEDLKNLLNREVFFNSLNREHERIWNEFAPNSSSRLINLMSASLKTRLLNDYLVKVDRASMYASLEMRSPFLDKSLAEFAATLKPNQLFYKNATKSILKTIAEKYFSKRFTHRSKMGFSVPLGDWFRRELSHDLKQVVLGGRQRLVDLDYQFVERLLKEHTDGVADRTHQLWSLYVFHVWANSQ